MAQYQLQEVCHNEIIEGKCYFIIETGKSCNSKMEILHHLLKQRPGLKEVHSVKECNVILVFCTIFSRAGTDIDAALNELSSCSASKPAIFMVLHHTFDPEKVIPDSSRNVTRTDTLTVDCLFHEDTGLLKCKRNEEALTKIVQRFKHQDQSDAFLSYFRKWNLPYIILLIKCFDYIFAKVKDQPNAKVKDQSDAVLSWNLPYIILLIFNYIKLKIIFLPYIIFDYIFAKVKIVIGYAQGIWNYFRGTDASRTNKKRHRLSDPDGERNA